MTLPVVIETYSTRYKSVCRPATRRLHVLFLFDFFFFNDTATTEIYTLSLHDALPICGENRKTGVYAFWERKNADHEDRKSTRLNSSHMSISYAVFCLKKKKKFTNMNYNTHLSFISNHWNAEIDQQ